jgi:hypothetical protein
MGYGSLSRVLTGWTGSVLVVGPDVEVTPYARDSVASLIARCTEVALAYGYVAEWSVGSNSKITLSSASTAEFALTGNTETRVGKSSFSAGDTATTAYANAWTPANGLRVGGVMLATSKSGMTGDQGYGVPPHRVPGSTRIVVWDSQLQIADFSHEYDVWHDGRLFGRFVARDVRRVPLGRLRNTTTVSVEIDALEVA